MNDSLTGGDIVINGEGILERGISTLNFEGGTVFIDARNNIEVVNSAIITTSLGEVGDINLIAGDTIRFDGADGSRLTGAFANIASNGEGVSGEVIIQAANLEVLNGAQINSVVFGRGAGGNVTLDISETARFVGVNPIDGIPSGANSAIGRDGEGRGGDLEIHANTLEVLEGAQLSTGILGEGEGGDVILDIADTARFVGIDSIDGNPSGAKSIIGPNGEGRGGDVVIRADALEVLGGAQLDASILGTGEAGSVILDIADTARFVGSNPSDGSPGGAFNQIRLNGNGRGGDVEKCLTLT